MFSIELDIHTHTIASGHASTATITDMVKAASTAHLKLLGISDHGPATLGGGKPSYFRSLPMAARKRLGVNMLYGIEANITDYNGTLDLEDSLLAGLDYVIASIHKPVLKPGTEVENTKAYLRAMENPFVSILGHCDDVKYPVDYLAIIKSAMEHQVILEINNSSLSPDGYRGDTKFNDLMILNLCKHFHYPVLLSSDSHGPEHVGDFRYALELVEQAEFPKELVLNYSTNELMSWLEKRKVAI